MPSNKERTAPSYYDFNVPEETDAKVTGTDNPEPEPSSEVTKETFDVSIASA